MPAKATNTDRAPRDKVSQAEAARILGCRHGTVLRYTDRGLLRPFRPHGRGRGKPTWYSRSEVERLRDRLSEG